MNPETDSPRHATYVDVSAYGIAAGYPQRIERRVLVAPSTGTEFNLIQPFLVTTGCALVPDQQFEFDSSFILPEADKAFRQLVKLIQRMPESPLSVFGHADPIGKDRYNKTLSGRRAMAVYAVLIRDTDLWEEKLYKRPAGGDKWGTRSVQIMLNAVGHPLEKLFGRMDEETREAVKAFQSAHGLEPDRDPGPITRKKLFEVYMDRLCTDENGQPFKVEKEAFLGAGMDPDGKADYQGCGEHNPILIFSEKEHKDYRKTEYESIRNQANAPNRRVIVYLFEKGTRVDPKRWPCPRVKEGSAGCRKRFWKNGDDRRFQREPNKRRQFKESEDTFACRFYHRLAGFSPCEAGLKLWVIRLKVDGPDGKIPLAGKRYVLIAGETAHAPIMRGTTDTEGILRIPVSDDIVTMTLKLDVSGYLIEERDSEQKEQPKGGQAPVTSLKMRPAEPSPDEEWEGEDAFLSLTLKGGALLPISSGADAARQRLYNLGYGGNNPSGWDTQTEQPAAIRAFQEDHGIEASGTWNKETTDKLREMHGS